jgi:hypothetical protein
MSYYYRKVIGSIWLAFHVNKNGFELKVTLSLVSTLGELEGEGIKG